METIFFFVKRDENQELEDLRSILKMSAGRRLFRRLLNKSNVLGQSFSADVTNTEFNEGLRRLGLWLSERIETAVPGELGRLIAESSNDRQDENNKPRRNEDD